MEGNVNIQRIKMVCGQKRRKENKFRKDKNQLHLNYKNESKKKKVNRYMEKRKLSIIWKGRNVVKRLNNEWK